MSLADAAGPAGLSALLLGMVIFGESRDSTAWTAIGLTLFAVGVVLLFAISR